MILANETPAARDYYLSTSDLADEGLGWDRAEIVVVRGVESVPARCADCGRATYYDSIDDDYHHAALPTIGCFLIAGEDREDDLDHPALGGTGFVAPLDALAGELLEIAASLR